MKPIAELLEIVGLTGTRETDASFARCLSVSPQFIAMWRPREIQTKDKRTIIEPGWEPSAGFIGCALAILRPYQS